MEKGKKSMAIVEFKDVSRVYRNGDHEQRALDLLTALASEYELKLVLGLSTLLVSILLTFGVSLAVGLMVARKNRHIDMVAALKTAE
jgi:hypothetical protein